MTVKLSTPSCNQRVQKEYSYYTSKSDFVITLHEIKRELNPPEGAIAIIDWFLHNAESVANSKEESKYGKTYGCRFASNETIAEDMNCCLSKIEKGSTWLKRIGIYFVKRTKGTAYKYWAEIKEIKNAIKNYFKSLFGQKNTGHNTGHDTGHDTGLKSEEIPCESRAQEPKNDDHIRTIYKTDIKNTIKNNRINDSTTKKGKFGIKKEIKTFLEESHFFNLLDDEKQNQYARCIQLAFIKTGTNMQDKDAQNIILSAIPRVIREYEKKRQNVRTDIYGAIYSTFRNALYDYRLEQDKFLEYAESKEAYAQTQKQTRKGFLGLLDEMQEEQPTRKDITAEVDDVFSLSNLIDQQQTQQRSRKPIRKEIVPDWLKAQEAPQGRETFLESNHITQYEKTSQEPISEAYSISRDIQKEIDDLYNGVTIEQTKEEKRKANEELLTRDVNSSIKDKTPFLCGIFSTQP